jgi:predicted metal-dependent enzyme (double-stranded beta helix superfamily)
MPLPPGATTSQAAPVLTTAGETGPRPCTGQAGRTGRADVAGLVGLSPAALGRMVRRVASGDQWLDRVMFRTDRRWFSRLELTEDYEIWLLSWLPGQRTGLHDHGEAAGAFAVAQGALRETLARPGSRELRHRQVPEGTVRPFGQRHLHEVANVSAAPAVSVHAYSPPLTAMRRYEMTPSGLALVRTDHAELDW